MQHCSVLETGGETADLFLHKIDKDILDDSELYVNKDFVWNHNIGGSGKLSVAIVKCYHLGDMLASIWGESNNNTPMCI